MVAIMTACLAFFLFTKDYQLEAFGIKLTFFMGVVVATSLFYFIKSFPKNQHPNGYAAFFMVIVLGIAFYTVFFTDLIAGAPIMLKAHASDIVWGWQYGPYVLIYEIVILFYYVDGLRILIKTRIESGDSVERKNIAFMITGIIMGLVSPLIFNTLLPQFGYYNLAWLGPTIGIIWVPFMAFSIVKYHQMNVRVVVTEVLVIVLVIASFINIFLSDIVGITGRIVLFAAFAVLGLYLVNTSVRESEQRELLSDLNKNLQERVDEATQEIRSSYQVERNAHLELEKIDEAKNQFILITQHHLRTPITSIKWQLESIMNGTYGPVTIELKKAMGDMNESIERLNRLINNLLSISALKAGIETLNKASINMKVIVDEVLVELKKEMDRKHIEVHGPGPKDIWPAVLVDHERMREVMFIILENAVRYNQDSGSISVYGHATENSFELTVENTGAELSVEDKKKIFTELFYRSNQAQTTHPTGMGIGLSMAQAIIQAHGGSISLGSRQSGGGVKVVVTLPYS